MSASGPGRVKTLSRSFGQLLAGELFQNSRFRAFFLTEGRWASLMLRQRVSPASWVAKSGDCAHSCGDRCHQRLDANDIHHPREIVGEHMQRLRWRPSAAFSSESALPPYAPSWSRRGPPCPRVGRCRPNAEGKLHPLAKKPFSSL